MIKTVDQLKNELVTIGRLMYDKGFISGSEGNISYRLNEHEILITPSGVHKGFLTADQIITVDPTGNVLASTDGLRPTSELPMHLEVYQQRSDVNAVVHAHPHHAIVLSIANIPIAKQLIPEVEVFLGEIPTTPYATPSSRENAEAIERVIVDHDALVLQRHGSLTVGRTLMEAFMRLETVENSAKITYLLAQLGVDSPIPQEQLVKLQAQRLAMFGK